MVEKLSMTMFRANICVTAKGILRYLKTLRSNNVLLMKPLTSKTIWGSTTKVVKRVEFFFEHMKYTSHEAQIKLNGFLQNQVIM
jgi:hypothetical protein